MKSVVDEYTLNCSDSKEYNDLIIMFSPHIFGKVKMKNESQTLPISCTLDEFKRWEIKMRKLDPKIQFMEIGISISKQ